MILKDLATNDLLKRFQFKELSQRLYKYLMTRVCLITMRKLMRFQTIFCLLQDLDRIKESKR